MSSEEHSLNVKLDSVEAWMKPFYTAQLNTISVWDASHDVINKLYVLHDNDPKAESLQDVFKRLSDLVQSGKTLKTALSTLSTSVKALFNKKEDAAGKTESESGGEPSSDSSGAVMPPAMSSPNALTAAEGNDDLAELIGFMPEKWQKAMNKALPVIEKIVEPGFQLESQLSTLQTAFTLAADDPALAAFKRNARAWSNTITAFSPDEVVAGYNTLASLGYS